MPDQFLPPDWFSQSATWPYWPKSLLSPFTQPAYEPWNQVTPQSWQQPIGAGFRSITPSSNNASSQVALPVPHPSSPSGGILGSFPQENDAEESGASAASLDGSLGPPRGILAPLEQRNTVGGILAPLERLNPGQGRSPSTWWQPAAPFAGNLDPFATPSSSLSLDPLRSSPAMRNAAAQQPSDVGTAMPPPYLDSTTYWGAAPPSLIGASEPSTTYGLYLSPVPTTPGRDSVPPYPADGAAQDSAEPPTVEPSNPVASESGMDSAPADEVAQAQQARDAAALRLGRRERAAVERAASPPPSTETVEGEPSLAERLRLHFLDSYYRGGLLGALRLASLARLATTPDPPGTSPEIRRVNDNLRQEYSQIIGDLARYDRMHSFRGASEFGAAALGQFGGGMLSPESWVGIGAKGANWLRRAGKAGVQQAITNTITDPIAQLFNIRAGVQDQYDLLRNAIAAGAGFVGGATGRSLVEALTQLGARLAPTLADILERNRAKGLAFEEKKLARAREQGVQDLAPQLTLRTQSGAKTRMDATWRHPTTNEIELNEFKSSDTAPLTRNQSDAFPEIEKSGAVVVGKGKPGFPGGTVIPPTRINIVRP